MLKVDLSGINELDRQGTSIMTGPLDLAGARQTKNKIDDTVGFLL